MDPYQKGLIPNNIYFSKVTITGKITAIMNASIDNRKLLLIQEQTRAFKKNDQIEIIATNEKRDPNNLVNKIAYIAFIEVRNGGVIRIGDTFEINGEKVGQVLGFDATHVPNHYNLIIHVNELQTGKEMELSLNDDVKFVF